MTVPVVTAVFHLCCGRAQRLSTGRVYDTADDRWPFPEAGAAHDLTGGHHDHVNTAAGKSRGRSAGLAEDRSQVSFVVGTRRLGRELPGPLGQRREDLVGNDGPWLRRLSPPWHSPSYVSRTAGWVVLGGPGLATADSCGHRAPAAPGTRSASDQPAVTRSHGRARGSGRERNDSSRPGGPAARQPAPEPSCARSAVR
jgi:hypothetical protein